MDDITSAISKILEDPESVTALKSIAGSFMKKDEEPDGASPAPSADMAKIMKLVTALKNRNDDDRTRLLMSLKPYVSPERRTKIDEAVKILRLVSILPAVGDLGIL